MEDLTHYPLLLFVAVFVVLWLASVAGSWLRRRNPKPGDAQNEDLGVILGATLTLLALIIGFQHFDGQQSLRPAQNSGRSRS